MLTGGTGGAFQTAGSSGTIQTAGAGGARPTAGTGGTMQTAGAGGTMQTAGAGGDAGAPGGAAGTPQGNPNCPPVPPTDPGNPATGCSIVGTWALNSSHGSVHSIGLIQFRSDGSYYGGPTGVDLTQAYTYDGEYAVSGSTFELIFSCGDGTCVGAGTFTMAFQSNCALAMLTESLTQCTGNRTAVAGQVVLIRQN